MTQEWASELQSNYCPGTPVYQLEQGKHGVDAQKAMSTLKGLTIQGYVTTEYVMVNHLNYQMAPGFWNPCVPVNK